MFDITLGGAFLAGLISFVSPCVLPIVPPYLCYLAGVGVDQMRGATALAPVGRRLTLTAAAFVLGFSTVFIALGATASLLGQTIAQWFDVLSVIAGAVIALMGLHFLGVLRIGLLYREARVEVERKPAGLPGAYVMGLSLIHI
jgi:cytochrome c-type biogenesis protein